MCELNYVFITEVIGKLVIGFYIFCPSLSYTWGRQYNGNTSAYNAVQYNSITKYDLNTDVLNKVATECI